MEEYRKFHRNGQVIFHRIQYSNGITEKAVKYDCYGNLLHWCEYYPNGELKYFYVRRSSDLFGLSKC